MSCSGGTNAVERIAAGEAVLRALLVPGIDGRPSPHAVLVATHDQELVDLLDGVYAAHHFTDTIDDSWDWPSTTGFSRAPPQPETRSRCSAREGRQRPSSHTRSRVPKAWIKPQ
jgi:hypothetical protein